MMKKSMCIEFEKKSINTKEFRRKQLILLIVSSLLFIGMVTFNIRLLKQNDNLVKYVFNLFFIAILLLVFIVLGLVRINTHGKRCMCIGNIQKITLIIMMVNRNIYPNIVIYRLGEFGYLRTIILCVIVALLIFVLYIDSEFYSYKKLRRAKNLSKSL